MGLHIEMTVLSIRLIGYHLTQHTQHRIDISIHIHTVTRSLVAVIILISTATRVSLGNHGSTGVWKYTSPRSPTASTVAFGHTTE